MNIQGFSGISQAYSLNGLPKANQSRSQVVANDGSGSSATQVTISDQAKALAFPEDAVAARLKDIKAKPATQRTSEEFEFVHKNDKKLAEIIAKNPDAQTADEIDYMQKASGFVNTMATLSPQEKKLYDELVAKGETEAMRGMSLIAMSRTVGGDVSLGNGVTFNPSNTEISADNVRNLFSKLFANEDGQNSTSFGALAEYLDRSKHSSLA